MLEISFDDVVIDVNAKEVYRKFDHFKTATFLLYFVVSSFYKEYFKVKFYLLYSRVNFITLTSFLNPTHPTSSKIK